MLISPDLLASLPAKPYFADYFQLVPLQLEKMLLQSPQRSLVLRGKLNYKLLPLLAKLLDGKRELTTILEILKAQNFTPFLVITLLQTLYKQGVLLDGAPDSQLELPTTVSDQLYHPQLLFFQQVSSRPAFEEQLLLGRAEVVVFGLGMLGSHLLGSLARSGIGHLIGVDSGTVSPAQLLGTAYPHAAIGQTKVEAAQSLVANLNPAVQFTGLDLECTPENLETALATFTAATAEANSASTNSNGDYGRSSRLIVAALDQPRPAFYEAINSYCLEHELNWTLGQLDNFVGLIGPSVIPFFGPCYHCYRTRVQSNVRLYEAQVAIEETQDSPEANHQQTGLLAPFTPLLAHSLSLEVLKLLGNYAYSEAVDRLLSFDFLNLKIEQHPVLKLPNCAACGRLSVYSPSVSHYEQKAGITTYA
jgi:bacteriocin biosynthesis cyclodehydratase domain-containing protein